MWALKASWWFQLCSKVNTNCWESSAIKRQHAGNYVRYTWEEMLRVCMTEIYIKWHFTLESLQLWPHSPSLHINGQLIGYFCTRSEATIWPRRRQPVLDGPGHKAFKANWLIALSGPFPVPSLWPDASEAQMAPRSRPHQHSLHSKPINFTNTEVLTHGCLMSTTSLLSPLQRMKDAGVEINILFCEKMPASGDIMVTLTDGLIDSKVLKYIEWVWC